MRRRFGLATRETFSSLQHRNFKLFFNGQLISQIGNWLTLVAQTLLVLHLTNNNGVAAGVLTACQFLPVLLFGAWSGLIADRRDKRRLLILVQCLAMLQSFALAALAFMGHPPLLALYGVALFGGFATTFDNPARRAIVVEMVPPEKVSNAVSLNSALMTGSRIVGPAFAGLLIVTVGYGWCFLADGLSYIAVVVALVMMRPSEMRAAPVTPRAKGQIAAGFHYTRSEPELWVPLVMMTIIGTLAFNFNVVMPLFVKTSLHGTDTTFTLLYSVLSCGSLVAALGVARRVNTEMRQVVIGAALFGLSMLGMAAVPNLALAFVVGIGLGISSILFVTAATAIVQLRAAPEMRGRVLALQAIVFLGSTPIGGPIVGAICQQFGARAGLVVGGAGGLLAALYGTIAVRRRGVTEAAPVALDRIHITAA